MPAGTASKVMVIRHAEKPADPPPPAGVTADGAQDPESLIVDGWQRAGALACLFAPSRGPLQSPEIATPQWIYASGIAKHSETARPQETTRRDVSVQRLDGRVSCGNCPSFRNVGQLSALAVPVSRLPRPRRCGDETERCDIRS
jgi:hypothetical protein